MKAKATFLALLLVLASFLGACSDKTDNGENPGQSEERAQVLNLIETSEIPSLDSSLATDSVSFDVMNNIYEGLYRLSENDEPVLGMAAEEPAISEDGTTYTFKLRDAKWSNGDPVTAGDFEYAWKRALNPDTGAEYAYIMYDIKNAAKVNAGELPPDQLGVKALDDKTLEVQLEKTVPYFKGLLTFATFYPQKESYITSQGDQFGLEADTTIYNGPFVLSEWKHEESFQLKKNDSYWDESAVKLDEINFNIVKDAATRVNLYETGAADVTGLTAEFVDKYKDDKNFQTRGRTSVYFLRLNQKNEVLANKNARKAIDMAWDKQSHVDILLNDGSIPAWFLVPGDFVTSPDGQDYREQNGQLGEYNPEKAAELWETALKELGKESVELELLNYDGDNSRKTGEFLKEELEKNLKGLTISISQQPFKQKLALESAGDYDFAYAGWGPDYPDPMTFVDMFVTDGPHNQMAYSNPELDRLIEAGKSSLLTDPEARWDALLEAEKIILEDQAISPMFQDGRAFLQKEYVNGILRHNFGAEHSYKWAEIK
ncbi:peptide ABC transporter substrate-binding protein [Rossellomorea aquimaris]|uniref:peptide ABC transporter substrate-binding protein n=1 Tax=Rossellomorea aquimaris TaxID=189382 RepID=UPI001CD1D96C|nr:peptide ABC transporter substrate-binding protein [Rossellomorea aquimaris]MCA1055755.1 peptide ABC transporter substrate-binding protein [Rossellomorea aquimaris]